MDMCSSCEGEITNLDIALSKKFFGRQTKHIFCIECMALYFETTEEVLREKAEFFKKQGCELFG